MTPSCKLRVVIGMLVDALLALLGGASECSSRPRMVYEDFVVCWRCRDAFLKSEMRTMPGMTEPRCPECFAELERSARGIEGRGA
jgi:hypothetical protein